MKYTLKLERPSGVALPAGAHAEVEIRTTSPAVRAGSLVEAGPVIVRAPSSGMVELELTPSSQLTTPSGAEVLYTVTARWLDEGGTPVVGGHAEWGPLWLQDAGGDLAVMLSHRAPRNNLVEVSAGTTFLDGSRRPVADWVGLWIDTSKTPMVLMAPESEQ